MLVKICANFFLSPGGFNFKINYLKCDMECESIPCWAIWHDPHTVVPIAKQVLLLAQNFKILWKNSKILYILRYFSLKFLCNQIVKATGLILCGVTIVFFTLLLISKYVQKSKWVGL